MKAGRTWRDRESGAHKGIDGARRLPSRNANRDHLTSISHLEIVWGGKQTGVREALGDCPQRDYATGDEQYACNSYRSATLAEQQDTKQKREDRL